MYAMRNNNIYDIRQISQSALWGGIVIIYDMRYADRRNCIGDYDSGLHICAVLTPLPPPDREIASEGDQIDPFLIGASILLKYKGK